MLRVFRRPIQREAHTTLRRQPHGERPSMRECQLFSVQTRVMQQARETFSGRFKVVKESGKSGLAACSHAHEREDKITDSFSLMPVCVGQNEADILAEASGKRVLGHRRNNALTRGELVTTRLLFQMCPDFSCLS